MADIKQAAKWMIEGQSVRRAFWPVGELAVYTETSTTQMVQVSTVPTKFLTEDRLPAAMVLCLRLESVLADDWEIAE